MIMRSGAPWLTLAALVALTITGCTAAPPEQEFTPSVATMPEAQVLSGSGAQEVELEVPNGAVALSVRLACSDGRFSVYTMDMGQDRSGSCGGMAVLTLALNQTSPMHVTIDVAAEATFVAQLQFSDEPVPVNTPLAQDCDSIAGYLNAVTNADRGFAIGELDLAEWQTKVDGGIESLQQMTPTPVIEPLVEPLIEWGSSAQEPGVFTTSVPSAAEAAQNIAKQICTDGGRAIVQIGEYGG